MNFVKTFLDGKAGKNMGLPTGIPALDQAINGIQRKTSIGIAAAPKCGKTTLADFACVLSPYLHMEKIGKLDDIEWIYFSGEIDRVSKEFKFAAFFMANDFGVYNFKYKDTLYQMNQDYLMGRMLHRNTDDTEERIPISPEHEDMLKQIYLQRIIPLFGEYDDRGAKIRSGKIDFIEDLENPTGLNKYLMAYARRHGEFIEEKYYTADPNDDKKTIERKRIIGYKANNPEKYTIIITDHIRKPKRERGFTMKENIDKWLEYSTILRNLCEFTFIHIVHSNRQVANVDRLKFAGEWIYPTAEDIKDSGNVAEECTILLTLFNPNDEKYNLKRHFGVELKDFPNYRSLHLTESRYTEAPVHIRLNMHGGINTFTQLLSFNS